MALDIRVEDGVTVIAVGGRIDHTSAPAFKDALLPAVEQAVAAGPGAVLDMTGLDYISSAGLRILMMAAQAAKAKGGALLSCCLGPVVREIFEISRFSFVIPSADSVAAAVARLRGQP